MTHRDAIDFLLFTMSKNKYGDITRAEALTFSEGYTMCFPCADKPGLTVDIDFTEGNDVPVYFTLWEEDPDPGDEPNYEAYDSSYSYDFQQAVDMFINYYNYYIIDRRCNNEQCY